MVPWISFAKVFVVQATYAAAVNFVVTFARATAIRSFRSVEAAQALVTIIRVIIANDPPATAMATKAVCCPTTNQISIRSIRQRQEAPYIG